MVLKIKIPLIFDLAFFEFYMLEIVHCSNFKLFSLFFSPLCFSEIENIQKVVIFGTHLFGPQ